MKTQVALRLDEEIVERARRAAERENRSLANLVETALAEMLMTGSGEAPVLSVLDEDLEGIVALDDRGQRDAEETRRLQRLVKLNAASRRR